MDVQAFDKAEDSDPSRPCTGPGVRASSEHSPQQTSARSPTSGNHRPSSSPIQRSTLRDALVGQDPQATARSSCNIPTCAEGGDDTCARSDVSGPTSPSCVAPQKDNASSPGRPPATQRKPPAAGPAPDDCDALDDVISEKLQSLAHENVLLRQHIAIATGSREFQAEAGKNAQHLEQRVQHLEQQMQVQQQDHHEQIQRERRDAARACAAAAARVRGLEGRLAQCEVQRDQCMRAACAAEQLLQQLGAI